MANKKSKAKREEGRLDEFEKDTANLFIYPFLEVGDKKSNAFTKSFRYKNL